MAELIVKKWAAVYANDDFVCFETYSGLRRCGSDPAGKLLFAKPDDSSNALGRALAEALAASRMLRPDEIAAFFDATATEQRYEQWVAGLMQRFGYDSRKALFKHMKYCSVDQSGAMITLRPTHHEKLEAWSGDGIDKSQYVQLAEVSSPEEIGQAVQLALSRCTA